MRRLTLPSIVCLLLSVNLVSCSLRQGEVPDKTSSTETPKASKMFFSICRYRGTDPVVPVTVIETARGEIQFIRWTSKYFTEAGWTPEKRCIDVSERVQKIQEKGLFNYLNTAQVNGKTVICVGQSPDAPCLPDMIILTVKKEDNPKEVLRDIIDVKDKAAGPFDQHPQVFLETEKDLSLDIWKYLQIKPIEETTKAETGG